MGSFKWLQTAKIWTKKGNVTMQNFRRDQSTQKIMSLCTQTAAVLHCFSQQKFCDHSIYLIKPEKCLCKAHFDLAGVLRDLLLWNVDLPSVEWQNRWETLKWHCLIEAFPFENDIICYTNGMIARVCDIFQIKEIACDNDTLFSFHANLPSLQIFLHLIKRQFYNFYKEIN